MKIQSSLKTLTKINILFLVLLFIAFVFQAFVLISNKNGFRNLDFFTFWLAGRLTSQGQDIYDQTIWVGAHSLYGSSWIPNLYYVYPLITAALFVPFGMLPIETASFLWLIISFILIVKGDECRETTELFTKLNTWDKNRRFVVSRVLKPEKDRAQLSLLEGDEYEYFFFVTNTRLPSEKVVISYEKRGNAENYIKEAKYDMAVGHLLLKSFWANEAIFQMMMLAYNLFLLFKFDFLHTSEYRQQIKTFRLKYVFLAAKIIRTARYVVMKLSTKYPYQDVYKNCLS